MRCVLVRPAARGLEPACSPHAKRAAASGSALVEVCVAMLLLSLCLLGAAVAHQHALIVLRYSMDHRRALWIVSAAAESLRAGATTELVRRDWDIAAARVLREGRLCVRAAASQADIVEVSWRDPGRSGDITCGEGRACVAVMVAAARQSGLRSW
jgi:Tfp pilus assembly protein PilV